MRKYPKNNGEALATFLAKKAEIDAMIVRIAKLSDNNFGADPDKVNWGDVGSLKDYARHLRRITDVAFREGEHAE